MLTSVGAYQLEGMGAHLFEAIEGASHTVDLLTFVYRDPGEFGDDRVYRYRARYAGGAVFSKMLLM